MLNSKREDYKMANSAGYGMKADVILAEKTLEMLRLVEMAELSLKEKFHGDSSRWADAIVHVLMIKNSAHLWEERHRLSNDQELCHTLHESLTKTFSQLQAGQQGSGMFESSSYSSFMLTSSALIRVFSKFSNLLVKEGNFPTLDLTDSLNDLKNIEKNVIKCISKWDSDKDKENGNGRKTYDSLDATAKRCDSITSSSSSLSSTSCTSPSVLSTVAGTVECATTTVTTSMTVSRESSSTDLKCEVCHEKIVIFNHDAAFSRELHNDEIGHQRAIAAKRAELDFKVNENFASVSKRVQRQNSPTMTPKLTRSMSESDKGDGNIPSDRVLIPELTSTIRSTLNNQLGDQSPFITIISPREFSCSVCNCKISCLQNVLPHVDGKAHRKQCEIRQELGGNPGDVPTVVKSQI